MSACYDFKIEWRSLHSYIEMLSNVDESKCISSPPPRNLQPGDIYIYHNIAEPFGWKSDPYKWKNNGMKRLPIQDARIICQYYKISGGVSFSKRVYNLIAPPDCPTSQHFLIHYVGSLDRVKPRKPETSSILKIEDDNCHTDDRPIVIEERSSLTELTKTPRQRLTVDDIDSITAMCDQYSTFIKLCMLIPEFVWIFWNDDTLEQFKEMCRIFTHNDIPLIYDITYTRGRFHLSILTYRHPGFEGGPAVPLAYMLHQVKTSKVHRDFLKCFRTSCPEVDGKFVVTNGDAEIAEAINQSWPSTQHVYTWDYIEGVVRNWFLPKSVRGIETLNKYVDMIRDLLNSCSQSDFRLKLKPMTDHLWDKAFVDFFQRRLYQLVTSSGRWVNENLYSPVDGVDIAATLHLKPNLEKLFADETDETVAGQFVEKIVNLDEHYYRQIMMSFCKKGDYDLKPTLARRLSKSLRGVLSKIMSHVSPKNDFLDCDRRNVTSQGVANALVVGGKVTQVYERNCFVVGSLTDESDNNCVHLFPVAKCSCQVDGCHHIAAAALSIGMSLELDEDWKDKRPIVDENSEGAQWKRFQKTTSSVQDEVVIICDMSKDD